jgi:hypothetical protein
MDSQLPLVMGVVFAIVVGYFAGRTMSLKDRDIDRRFD